MARPKAIPSKAVESPAISIRRLIDHARETYPHFESERGQRDIAQAESALAQIGEAVYDLITDESQIENLASLGRWRRRILEINRLAREILSIAPPAHADPK